MKNSCLRLFITLGAFSVMLATPIEGQKAPTKEFIWPKAEKISPAPEPPGMLPFLERGMEFKIPSGWRKVPTDKEFNDLGLKRRTGFASFEFPERAIFTVWLAPKLQSGLVWKDLETQISEIILDGNVTKKIELKTSTKGDHPIILTFKGSEIKLGKKIDKYIIYGYKEPGTFSVKQGTYKFMVRILNPEKISEIENDLIHIIASFIHRPAEEVDAASVEFIKEVIKEATAVKK